MTHSFLSACNPRGTTQRHFPRHALHLTTRGAIGALTGSAWSDDPCGEVRIASPLANVIVSTSRPPITWAAREGVGNYRVRLTSRQPEGRTYATLDSWVSGDHCIPPQPLADGVAVVRVSVWPSCANLDTPSEQDGGHRFFVDARAACPLNGLAVTRSGDAVILSWQATPGADHYEVFGYSGLDGALLYKAETRESRYQPTVTPFAVPVAVAVRPRCREVYGEPRFALH